MPTVAFFLNSASSSRFSSPSGTSTISSIFSSLTLPSSSLSFVSRSARRIAGDVSLISITSPIASACTLASISIFLNSPTVVSAEMILLVSDPSATVSPRSPTVSELIFSSKSMDFSSATVEEGDTILLISPPSETFTPRSARVSSFTFPSINPLSLICAMVVSDVKIFPARDVSSISIFSSASVSDSIFSSKFIVLSSPTVQVSPTMFSNTEPVKSIPRSSSRVSASMREVKFSAIELNVSSPCTIFATSALSPIRSTPKSAFRSSMVMFFTSPSVSERELTASVTGISMIPSLLK